MPQEVDDQNIDDENEEAYESSLQEARQTTQRKMDDADKENILNKLKNKAVMLKKEIGEFSIVLFMIALILCGVKDLFDMFSVQLFSWLDWILDLILGIVLFFGLARGNIQQIKRIRLTTVLISVAEAIPIIGALPCWTISLFLLFIKTNQENSAKRVELEGLQKQIVKLENGK
ncbi:MAG: hypothetical protein AAB526_02320 [Patescibacteria group bacterium]